MKRITKAAGSRLCVWYDLTCWSDHVFCIAAPIHIRIIRGIIFQACQLASKCPQPLIFWSVCLNEFSQLHCKIIFHLNGNATIDMKTGHFLFPRKFLVMTEKKLKSTFFISRESYSPLFIEHLGANNDYLCYVIGRKSRIVKGLATSFSNYSRFTNFVIKFIANFIIFITANFFLIYWLLICRIATTATTAIIFWFVFTVWITWTWNSRYWWCNHIVLQNKAGILALFDILS